MVKGLVKSSPSWSAPVDALRLIMSISHLQVRHMRNYFNSLGGFNTVTELFVLEVTLKITWFQPSCHRQGDIFHYGTPWVGRGSERSSKLTPDSTQVSIKVKPNI